MIPPVIAARPGPIAAAPVEAASRPERAPALSTAAIDKAAEEFEALFAAQMLKPMFEGLKSDGMFSGGFAESAWRGVLIEAMGEQIAASGGLGLADAVRNALIQAQGHEPALVSAPKQTVEPHPE